MYYTGIYIGKQLLQVTTTKKYTGSASNNYYKLLLLQLKIYWHCHDKQLPQVTTTTCRKKI